MVVFLANTQLYRNITKDLRERTRGTASFLINDLFPADCAYSRSIPAAECSDCFHRRRLQICSVTVSAR